jgi:3-hydroxybutyryl-CoA dehydrogenase
MTRIAVIGAGTMGQGLARLFSAAGHDVTIFDERAAAAEACALGSERVVAIPTLAGVVRNADVCIEAVVEELEIKRGVFAALAVHARSDAILATNTSSLAVGEIAAPVSPSRRRRMLGAHFFNPPDVVPAVELVPLAETDPEVVAEMAELLAGAGKVPAVVADTPGFIANRIQHAMIAEAWRCLDEGLATADAIDAIVSGSFGFRLFAYGPFALGDFNGLDVYRSVLESLAAAYGDRFAPPRLLIEHVERGAIGVKSGAGAQRYEGDGAERAVQQRDRVLKRLALVRAKELVDGPAPPATA